MARIIDGEKKNLIGANLKKLRTERKMSQQDISNKLELLGVYVALSTVNCIMLGRAEMFASKNSVGRSALDGVGMGLGFTIALLLMATVREVLGAGSFAGVAIPFLKDHTIDIFSQAPGGLMVYGLLIFAVTAITQGKAPKKKSFGCEGCPSAANCSACIGKEEN